MNFFKTQVLPFWQEIWGKIKETVEFAMPYIKKIIDTVLPVIVAVWKDMWNSLGPLLQSAWEIIKGIVRWGMDVITGFIKVGLALITGDWQGTWEALKQMVWNCLNDILGIFGTSADRIWESGKNLIKKFIDGWKSLKIPMPHFKVSGSFSLNPPSVPSIGVDWYAKGGIFNGPQVIGVGEAGPEAVLPISKLPDLLGLNNEVSGVGRDSNRKSIVNNIIINVNGRRKDDRDIASEIVRQVRLQLSTVSI